MEASRNGQPEATSIKEILDTLKRQKWIVVGTLTIAILLGLLAVRLSTPNYTSTVRLIVAGRTQQFNNPNSQNDPLRDLSVATTDDVPTLIEQLQGSVLVNDVLNTVVATDPALRPSMQGDPMVTAKQIGMTNAIEVSVTSLNPDLAKRVAAAIPDAFQERLMRRNKDELNRGLTFVDGQLQTAIAASDQARRDLAAFRSQHNLTPSITEAADRANAALRAENDLNAARADYEAAQSALNVLVQARRGLPLNVPNPVVEKNIQQIQQAQRDVSELEAQRATLLATFREDALEVRQIDGRLRVARNFLRNLPAILDNQRTIRNPELTIYDQKISDQRATVNASRARVAEREANYRVAKERVDEFNRLQNQLDQLMNDVAIKDRQRTALEERASSIRLFINSVRNPVTRIEDSSPARQTRPNPPLYLGIALLMGIVAAVAICVVKDRLEDRIVNIDQAYRIADAPTLGYVSPNAFGRAAKNTKALPSKVIENYRIVRSNVLFSLRETNYRGIMVTSTGPGEGKSEVAANLAIAMAGAGKRTLIIDANVHRPDLHARFNQEPAPGLCELLAGEATLESTIRPTEVEGLSLITAGLTKVSLADGLGSTQMKDLYRSLTEQFDLVIFDTAPMLPRSDSLTLSAVVDAVVYVVKPGHTTRSTMKYCMELLKHAHARLLGVVFTNTDFYADEAS